MMGFQGKHDCFHFPEGQLNFQKYGRYFDISWSNAEECYYLLIAQSCSCLLYLICISSVIPVMHGIARSTSTS